MSFENFNPYLLIAIGGFFTGLGNVSAQWIWKVFLEKHATKHAKKIRKLVRGFV